MVTVVASFVPFSPLLGGTVAGSLHDEGTGRGTRVGLVAGLVAALPLAAVFFFLLSITSFGSIATGELGGPAFVVVLIGAILLCVGLYIVGLSTAGGYIGTEIAESRAEKRALAAAVDERAASDVRDEPDDANTDDDTDAATVVADENDDESVADTGK